MKNNKFSMTNSQFSPLKKLLIICTLAIANWSLVICQARAGTNAAVLFNTNTGALSVPSATAFYAANPPPGGPGGAANAVTNGQSGVILSAPCIAGGTANFGNPNSTFAVPTIPNGAYPLFSVMVNPTTPYYLSGPLSNTLTGGSWVQPGGILYDPVNNHWIYTWCAGWIAVFSNYNRAAPVFNVTNALLLNGSLSFYNPSGALPNAVGGYWLDGSNNLRMIIDMAMTGAAWSTNTQVVSVNPATGASNGPTLWLPLPGTCSNINNTACSDTNAGWFNTNQNNIFSACQCAPPGYDAGVGTNNQLWATNCILEYGSNGGAPLCIWNTDKPIIYAWGICMDSSNNLWVGGRDTSWNSNPNGMIQIFKVLKPAPGQTVCHVIEANSQSLITNGAGNPLYAIGNGLAVMPDASGKFILGTAEESMTTGAPSTNFVYEVDCSFQTLGLSVDCQGNITVGTGLPVIFGTRDNGIYGNSAIGSDSLGNINISTPNQVNITATAGFNYPNYTNGVYQNITVADASGGFPGDCNGVAAALTVWGDIANGSQAIQATDLTGCTNIWSISASGDLQLPGTINAGGPATSTAGFSGPGFPGGWSGTITNGNGTVSYYTNGVLWTNR
jgi:hypothetical protein